MPVLLFLASPLSLPFLRPFYAPSPNRLDFSLLMRERAEMKNRRPRVGTRAVRLVKNVTFLSYLILSNDLFYNALF